MIPSEVALLVCWNTQIDKAKPVMLEVRIETACPAKTIVRPIIPDGRFEGLRAGAMLHRFAEPGINAESLVSEALVEFERRAFVFSIYAQFCFCHALGL